MSQQAHHAAPRYPFGRPDAPDRPRRLARAASPLRGRRTPGGQERDQHIVAFVLQHLSQHRIAPTLRQIGGAVGLSSPSSVKHRVDGLVRQGRLRRDEAGRLVEPL